MTVERAEGPTPAGGAYSEATYLDENGNLCAPEDAATIFIGEYDQDGNLLKETIASAVGHRDR